MSKIKVDADKIERGVLNTTIDKDVLDGFRRTVKLLECL